VKFYEFDVAGACVTLALAELGGKSRDSSCDHELHKPPSVIPSFIIMRPKSYEQPLLCQYNSRINHQFQTECTLSETHWNQRIT
jgi:hypothetical protein